MEKPLLIVAVLFVVFMLFSRFAGGSRISGQQARAMVSEGALLLDVRTPAEYRSGHIDGAKNIPVQELSRRLNDVGPKDQTIVVYCRSGARSGKAASMLKSSGFDDVHNLGPQSAW